MFGRSDGCCDPPPNTLWHISLCGAVAWMVTLTANSHSPGLGFVWRVVERNKKIGNTITVLFLIQLKTQNENKWRLTCISKCLLDENKCGAVNRCTKGIACTMIIPNITMLWMFSGYLRYFWVIFVAVCRYYRLRGITCDSFIYGLYCKVCHVLPMLITVLE